MTHLLAFNPSPENTTRTDNSFMGLFQIMCLRYALLPLISARFLHPFTQLSRWPPIARLLREHMSINFNTVAKAAGVSKAYLYSQPQLRDRIEVLRQQEREQTVRERVASPTGKTDAAKDLVILAKERRIKELEEENRKLKQQLKAALGKAYDRL